jgi:hypothetical protein
MMTRGVANVSGGSRPGAVTALAVHRGESPEPPTDEAVESFVGRIESLLRRETE